MTTLRNVACLFAAFLTLGAMSSPGSAAPIIDDFTVQLAGGATGANGLLSSAVATPLSSGSQSSLGNILGSRLVTVDNNDPVTGSSSVQISGLGTLDLATSAANTNGTILTLAYSGFGTLDLTGSASIALNLAIFNAGVNPLDFPTLTVQFTDASSGLQTLGPLAITGTGPLSVSFGALDRNEVTSISFLFALNQGEDVVLDNQNGGIELIPGIPEPMTFATFGALALVGGFAARRKLKATAVAQA